MGVARLDFIRMPEVQFWKLCGSGTGQGFSPTPNTAVWAILAAWPDAETARDKVTGAPIYNRWKSRASESCHFLLGTTQVRGAWAGEAPFHAEAAPNTTGPVAALTRATLKPRVLAQFWRKVPAIEQMIAENDALRFKIGIGEMPWLHQITFSIWPDTQAMAEFARKDGAHAEAIKAVRAGDWFGEELYARFRILSAFGDWEGRPLPQFSERCIA